jgi:hypothetical protein
MAAEASRLAVVEHDASLAAEDDASRRPRGDASHPGGTRRLCAWCRGPIPERARRDAVCCSVRCRQARADVSPSRQTRRISKRTSWADYKLPRGPDASDLGGGLRTVRAPTGGAKLARST